MSNELSPGELMQVDSAPDDLAHGQEVGQHRFTMFTKGERYAYARGLEVSPAHLPRALDAMLADGWKLVSLFGQTDAKSVGFIFERIEPEFNGLEYAHGMGVYAEVERLRKRVDELLGANNGLVEDRREARRKLSEYQSGVPFDQIRTDSDR